MCWRERGQPKTADMPEASSIVWELRSERASDLFCGPGQVTKPLTRQSLKLSIGIYLTGCRDGSMRQSTHTASLVPDTKDALNKG